MRRTRAWAAAIGIAITACGDSGGGPVDAAPDAEVDGPSPDAGEAAVPRAEAGPCRFEVPPALGLVEGVGYSCGDLIVYEDRVAKGRTIQVHYIVVESTAASTNATIYLAGGPGGDGENILAYAASLGAPFLDGLRVDGDFLVISQRGTSKSVPFLDCQQFDCADFSGTYDLASYNTATNADDVDDLRAVLGYTKLNLYGISYGSRLALEVLRRHGDHVRAAVVEGLVPSSVAWPAAVPASFYSALTGLNASCAAASACATAFGDLTAKFSAGVASLNTTPVPISIGGSPFDLDGYTYAFVLFRVLYARSTYTWLPMLISDLAERRTDRVESFLGAALVNLGSGDSISRGLYNAVVCSEIFNPPSANAFTTLNAGVPSDIVEMFGDSWFGLMETCTTWPAASPALQAELAVPVASSVRTLVSSGRLDPITPPGFGDVAAATLSDSVVVIHESSGHGATLQSPCGVQNLSAFLADPAADHDTSCAAEITTPYMLPSTFTAPPVAFAQMRRELRLAPPLPPAVAARLRDALAR